MSDAARNAREVLRLYEKHGWTLRRVLLCDATRETLPASLEDLFGGAPILSFETDALWFSRRANNGGEAWELRRLSGSPFALVELFAQSDDEPAREEARRAAENRLKVKSGEKRSEK